MFNSSKALSAHDIDELITILKRRFEKNMKRHSGICWSDVLGKLNESQTKLFSLYKMEHTGGEPDVVAYDSENNEFIFFDCSLESPKGRRSLCYDKEAQASRKKFKPKNSAIALAEDMGIKILSESEYRELQKLGNFDTKTSSWIETPAEIRKLGGALFADFRFNNVFVYHNGAESYYAARGFRGSLRV